MTTKILKFIKYGALIAFFVSMAMNIWIILSDTDYSMFLELSFQKRIFTLVSVVGFAFLASLFKYSFIIIIFLCINISERQIKKTQLS